MIGLKPLIPFHFQVMARDLEMLRPWPPYDATLPPLPPCDSALRPYLFDLSTPQLRPCIDAFRQPDHGCLAQLSHR
jgi:hypothetical protein